MGGGELKMLGEMILNVSNIKWSNNDKIYNYIDLTSVDMQNHQIGNLSNISKEKHPSRAQQIVKFNDIIFATTRPMQKRIAMIPKYLDGQICSTGYCVLRVDEKIALSSWVYYVLCTSIFYDYVDKFQQGASYPSISDNIVKKFKIPVPSLQTQQKVVEILDKFDTLVNSITEGLPREIELRRKQYEHYRELLLNFKPKMRA
ncbi:restriction endonuclease subunit S [Campylobacter concisus]|uniref:restriction endonuclease subunit S n=1 Tax=Campylobacter concisus TaxID=199 RepID=UPI00112F91C4|nr:restriction endonuclease subunit S [Campylobacter concisus]